MKKEENKSKESNILAYSFKTTQLPNFITKRSKEYVYFDDDNLFPERLINLYNSSAINKTAIDAIVAGIIGDGFEFSGEEKVNKNGETIQDLFEKIALDWVLFGSFSLNVIWNRASTKIAEIYHLNPKTIRSGKIEVGDKVNSYFYSRDWSSIRKYKPKEYPAFSQEAAERGERSQILYVKSYNPDSEYYGLPSYVGALNDIELDARISKFHNANIANGLSPSLVIKFKNGNPSPEKKREIYREIEETYAGELNAGRFLIFFSEPGREAEVMPIESANDTYYTTLEERITSRVLTAHRITSPLLLGIRSGTGLGSNKDEIITAFGHFFGTVISPIQKYLLKDYKKIIEMTTNPIYDLRIINSKPIFEQNK